MPVEVSRPSAAWVPKVARGAQHVEGPLQGSPQAAPARGLGVTPTGSAPPAHCLLWQRPGSQGHPQSCPHLTSSMARWLQVRRRPTLHPPCPLPAPPVSPGPRPSRQGPAPPSPLTSCAQQAGALQHSSRRQPRTHCCVPGSPVPGLTGLQAAVSGQRKQSEACSGPPHLSVAFSSLVPSWGTLGGPGGRLAVAQRGHRPGELPRCPCAHLCSRPGASPRRGKPWL